MTVRVYSSSDVGAPVLRGNTPGDFINVLDKCLVTGYGEKQPAGWSKPFSGVNVAAFQQGEGSNGMFLRIDDTSTATSYRAARVVGYENMTDVNTGLPAPFPDNLQMPGGFYWHQQYSTQGNLADPRPWTIIADEAFFWLLLKNLPSQSDDKYNQEAYCFGDIIPLKPGDTTHTILTGGTTSNAASSGDSYMWNDTSMSNTLAGSRALYFARSFTNLGGAARGGWAGDAIRGSGEWGQGYLQYPHGPDGGLYLSPVLVHENAGSPYNVRGILPGAWKPLHYGDNVFRPYQTIEGQGDLQGRTFMIHAQGGATPGYAFLEISDTWR